MGAPYNIGPKLAQAFDAAGRRTPKRRVADEKRTGECLRAGLEQGIEGGSIACERMRWCCQIDLLAGKDVELGGSPTETFELRQMRMQVECIDTMQEAEPIERRLHLDRRRGAIRFGLRPKPEAVFDRHVKAGEERAREGTELLLRRDRLVSVVEEVRDLPLQALVMREVRHIADVGGRRRRDGLAARGTPAWPRFRRRSHLGRSGTSRS